MANELDLADFEPTAAVPMSAGAYYGIGGASLIGKVVGIAAAQPNVVIGTVLADLALTQISGLPKSTGVGSRIGYAAGAVAMGGLLTWWAMARKNRGA